MVNFDKEFDISLEPMQMPFSAPPQRMDKCIICLCTHGSIDMDVDMLKYHCESQCIINLFPMQLVSSISASEDFRFVYIIVSDVLFNEVAFSFPSEFIGFLRDNFYHNMNDTPASDGHTGSFARDMQLFSLIKEKFEDYSNVCRKDIVISLLRVFFMEAYNDVYKHLSSNMIKKSRKHIIIKDFFQLIMRYGRQQREVSFYADKLCITPKYLSMITRELDGRGAKECIDDYVITEIKLRLNSSVEPIQEIAADLRFANQAFLSKYFKLHTGLSPSEWRKNKRFIDTARTS